MTWTKPKPPTTCRMEPVQPTVYNGRICEHDVARTQELLHRFWGLAHDHKEYHKPDWIEFQALLDKLCHLATLVMR